jgi:UDP-4-amino-4,6-dideoxy-N-acetyl-beta-L-altrosamine N-acetyltransferase
MAKSDFRLRPIEERDLELVLEWRNSERVRSKMFESQLIPRENHWKWFASLQGSQSNYAWIFEYQEVEAGVVTLKRVDEKEDKWIWGCYLGDRKLVPKAGTIMGFMALEQFFDKMGLRLIIGEAVAANTHSLEFNKRIGFDIINEFTRTTSLGVPVPATLLTLYNDQWKVRKPAVEAYCFSEPAKL